MSFSLPSVKAKPEASAKDFQDTLYGVPNLMATGFSSAHHVAAEHPIFQSEKNFRKNQQQLHMTVLRNLQGLHAPLRIGMELKAAQKIGHLPFLPQSNAMHESLTGRDIEIGPEDVFNTSEFRETMASPHAVLEKNLGLMPL